MWNPDVYLSFADKRTRPAIELASRISVTDPALIYDLGCGPGNSTEVLATRWPSTELIGVDSSNEMLERAAEEGPNQATWLKADLSAWVPDLAADVIFSNATYQWIDDHGQLLPKLLDTLRPGGVLALQMPQNFAAPSHVLMREIASEGVWAEKLKPILRHHPVGTPGVYYDFFNPHAENIDIWETEYAQELEGDDPVFDWVSGTALRPLLTPLNEEDREQFSSAYRKALRKAYPKRANGLTLFPFKRIFIVVTRQSE